MVPLELAVRGCYAAPGITVVDYVVVDQGCGMKEFQSRCKIYDPVLFDVFVGIDGHITEGHCCAPAPICEASAKSLSAVKERFRNIREGISVGRNLWDFSMRSRDDFSQIFGDEVNEGCWGTHGSTLAKHALHCY
jgi:hypothetical protein